MSITNTERRLIENEIVFRRSNEKVRDELKTLDDMHREDGHKDLTRDENLKMYFKCECSDENCKNRIPMFLRDYEKIHADRSVFIVIPNHEVDSIEKVIKKTPEYNVVKKKTTKVEPSDTLNPTNVNNA
jgi:hypothetical protein